MRLRSATRRGSLDLVADPIGITLEVLTEHAGELYGLGIVSLLVGPCVSGVEDLAGDSGNRGGHAKAKMGSALSDASAIVPESTARIMARVCGIAMRCPTP
jgi:hypothetical protein